MLRASARGPLTIYPIEHVRDFGVDAFVTDRFGGVSQAPYDSLNLGDHVGDDARDVTENRRRLADAIGVSPPTSSSFAKYTDPTFSPVRGC